jgi:hypothetical protein
MLSRMLSKTSLLLSKFMNPLVAMFEDLVKRDCKAKKAIKMQLYLKI